MSVKVDVLIKLADEFDMPEQQRCFLKSELKDIRRKLNFYRQALTKAVSLPKGILPSGKGFYTWMDCGSCIIKEINF